MVRNYWNGSAFTTEKPDPPSEPREPECPPEIMSDSERAIRREQFGAWAQRSILEPGGALVFMSANDIREPEWYPAAAEPVDVRHARMLAMLAMQTDLDGVKAYWVDWGGAP